MPVMRCWHVGIGRLLRLRLMFRRLLLERCGGLRLECLCFLRKWVLFFEHCSCFVGIMPELRCRHILQPRRCERQRSMLHVCGWVLVKSGCLDLSNMCCRDVFDGRQCNQQFCLHQLHAWNLFGCCGCDVVHNMCRMRCWNGIHFSWRQQRKRLPHMCCRILVGKCIDDLPCMCCWNLVRQQRCDELSSLQRVSGGDVLVRDRRVHQLCLHLVCGWNILERLQCNINQRMCVVCFWILGGSFVVRMLILQCWFMVECGGSNVSDKLRCVLRWNLLDHRPCNISGFLCILCDRFLVVGQRGHHKSGLHAVSGGFVVLDHVCVVVARLHKMPRRHMA